MTTKHHHSATARRMEGQLARIARVISKNWGVEVRFTGNQCKTDGNVIYLPYNAEYLGEDKKQLIHGNLDHETAHVAEEREAREAGKPTPLDIMKAERNTTTRMLFNAFEDIRIETKYAAMFPGVAQNLAAINKQSVEMFHMRHGKGGPRNFWHLFGCAIIAQARGFDYSWCPAPVLAWLPLIQDEVGAARAVRDASEAMVLARAVYAKVRAAAEDLKEQQEDSEGEGEDSSDETRLAIHTDDDEKSGPQEGKDPKEDNDIHMDLREEKPKRPEVGEDEDQGEGEDSDDVEDDVEGDDGAEDSDGDMDNSDGDMDNSDGDMDNSDGADDDDVEDGEGDDTEGEGDESEGASEFDDDTEGDEGDADGGGDEDEDGEGDTEGDEGDADGGGDGGGSVSGVSSDSDDSDGDNSGDDEAPSTAGDNDDSKALGSDNVEQSDSPGDMGSDEDEGKAITEDGIDIGDVDLENWDPTAVEATEEDIANEVRRDIEDAASEDIRKGRYVPHPKSAERDRWYKPTATSLSGASLLTDYTNALEGVREQVGALRSRLISTIRILSTSRRIGDQTQGQLDSASLHSLRTGNKRVFNQEVRGMELDTAVEIVLDLSGSMGPRTLDKAFTKRYGHMKSWYAHRVAIALAETFDKLGVPFEVIGFHNNYGRLPAFSSAEMRAGFAGTGYQCREPFDFLVFKAFDEPLRRCRERFAAINGYDDNCDGEAVRLCGRRLAFRPEARKILFVVSDGMPAVVGSDFDLLNQDLCDAVTELTKAGVEVFGIGVQTDAVKKFYNKQTGAASVVIDNLDQMAVEVYKAVRAKLIKSNRETA